MDFPTAVTLLSSTFALAGVYALINAGFVLLYRTTGVINFAQGQFMLVGAFLMVTMLAHFSYWWSFSLVVIALFLIGVGIYLVLMRFLLGASEFPKVITTLMLATIITQIVSMAWGANPRVISSPIHSAISIGRARVPTLDLTIFALAIVLVLALMVAINKTVTGSRMRALANNEALAVYSGMRVHYLGALAWGLAIGGSAIAGVVYAQRSGVTLELPLVGLGAFPAAVIGGMDSIGGTIPGALLVAAAQTMTVYYFGAVWGDIVAYSGMLLALLLLPRGLFGSPELRRL